MMMVKKLRLQHGWSQEHLSEISGLSTRTIQRIERGERASLESLLALSSVFEVDIEVLQQEDKMSNDNEKPADKSTKKRYVFYIHLAKFIVVVPVLFVVNYTNTPEYIWAWWVLLGWGIGITMHAMKVFFRKT